MSTGLDGSQSAQMARSDDAAAAAAADVESVARSAKYWNINVDPPHWSDECPIYLQGLDASDIAHLMVRDEDYRCMGWTEVHAVISGSGSPSMSIKPS